MPGRYLGKYEVQNTPFFQCFYIQTDLKVNKIQNCLFKMFKIMHGCYGNRENFCDNLLFDIRKHMTGSLFWKK